MNAKTERLLTLLALLLLATACQKKPDHPQQTVAATPNQPNPPPPVSSCQGATVPVLLPIYVQNDNTQQTSTVTGFDVGCGDTVQVRIKNVLLAPTDPWTTLTNDPNASSYYTVSGQQVTVNVHTGNTLYVEISAVLY